MKKLIIVLAVAGAVIYGAMGLIDAGERAVESYHQNIDKVVNQGE